MVVVPSVTARNEQFDEAQERIAVHLHENANPNELAAQHGYHNLGPVHGMDHHYVFQRKAGVEDASQPNPHSVIGQHQHVKWWQLQERKNRRRPLPHWNGEDERIDEQQRRQRQRDKSL